MGDINYIVDCVKNNIPIVYCKYGDGEYFCATKYDNNLPMVQNCDNDTYTVKLSEGVKKSFSYITEQNNVFIGRWFNQNVIDYWTSTAINKCINWIHYHTLLFDDDDINNNEKFKQKANLFNVIKQSSRKKIIVCNNLLIKSKILLNIDNIVLIPLCNWFDDKFDEVFNEVKNIIGGDENHIVLTCCGMGAKVLIAELHKEFPNGIYLDFGSGLDCICTKRNSRGWGYTYEMLYSRFEQNNLLPDDWNNEKYDYIYSESYDKLGTHLPK